MTDMKIHFEEPPIVGCKTANLTQLAKCKEDGKLLYDVDCACRKVCAGVFVLLDNDYLTVSPISL